MRFGDAWKAIVCAIQTRIDSGWRFDFMQKVTGNRQFCLVAWGKIECRFQGLISLLCDYGMHRWRNIDDDCVQIAGRSICRNTGNAFAFQT
jgi:hypothetical protein